MSKKKNRSERTVVRRIFGLLGRFLVTCMMVGVITGCIVACVMTVYIFDYVGADNSIDLDAVELGYTSTMYYFDKNTQKYEELQKLYITDNNRIWVNSSDISQHVKDAVVAVEDKRFYSHQGVDWRRTFGAFVSMFMPGASKGGGSTITQQLIKNITGDDDLRVDRKVREIFRALNLDKNYSKERILEAYLNVIPFGSGTNGIQSASLTYFGKEASELTLAEAASIVGITKYPTSYNPFLNPEKNKKRQEDVLFFMHEQGKITDQEYKDALDEPLHFKREEYQQQSNEIMNYYEDYVFTQVVNDLMDQKGWTRTEARDQLYKSGYKIYTCVDLEMQEYLEEFFLTTEKFPKIWNAEYPQACANIIDHNGKLLATVGGWGEKTGNLLFNRATSATRHPGSAIKPIGPYAVAFDMNRVNWSTVIVDGPINRAAPGKPADMWPTNYYGNYKGPVSVAYAIQQSVNTVSVKIVDSLTPQVVFDFLKDRLNFYNLVEQDSSGRSDIDLAPMALGALTKGVTPLEMVGGFQIFANGGNFTTPYCYTRVEDAEGNIVLEADTSPRYAIAEDTSVILNKALQLVTSQGTGTDARLDNMPTAGKTGTSDDDVNQWFIGMTPYYVCQVWLGYDQETRVNEYGTTVPNTINYYSPYNLGYPPPKLWKSIMAPLHEGLDHKPFMESENVVSLQYCTVTGKLAGASCPPAAGWYSVNNRPPTCTGHPETKGEDGERTEDGDRADDAPDDLRVDDGDTSRTDPLRVRDGSDDDDDGPRANPDDD